MSMQYRQLGRSGLRVSVYGLGTNAFGDRADERTSIAIVHAALDRGVNLIDTANKYTGGASERIIGQALRGRRDQVVLATKCGMEIGSSPNDRGSSRAHIFREVEGSLRRLGTDYIDLYQIHEFDATTPLEETLRALDDLVRQGKVRYIGCSNYAAWQLCKALWISDRNGLARYDSAQLPYSPADRRIEQEVIPLCLDQGVGILVYYPLAGGLLTGKYRPNAPFPVGSRAVKNPAFGERLAPRNLQLAQELGALADELGVSLAQMTLAWLLRRPGVTSVLVGATHPDQQAHNLAALELELPKEVEERIDLLSRDCITNPALVAPWFPVGIVDDGA
ncbi:MAG TPA: aldo/keto reductase [Bacillota bacterium]